MVKGGIGPVVRQSSTLNGVWAARPGVLHCCHIGCRHTSSTLGDLMLSASASATVSTLEHNVPCPCKSSPSLAACFGTHGTTYIGKPLPCRGSLTRSRTGGHPFSKPPGRNLPCSFSRGEVFLEISYAPSDAYWSLDPHAPCAITAGRA